MTTSVGGISIYQLDGGLEHVDVAGVDCMADLLRWKSNSEY